jgi:hypothetical protein
MGFWEAFLGMFAPEKYLHNRSLRDAEAHERRRHETNVSLARDALAIAQQGYAVELKCTNSGWVELRVVSSPDAPSCTVNGRVIDGDFTNQRRH